MKHALAALVLALPAVASAARPWFGGVEGTVSHLRLELRIDRRDRWDIVGQSNGQAVSVKIVDPHTLQTRLQGTANGRCVKAEFRYTPEKVSVVGAQDCPMALTVDYANNHADGLVHGKRLDLGLSIDNGYGLAQGTYGGLPARLQLTTDGALTGTLNGAPVSARVENADLSDVLEHLYILLKP